MTEELVDALAQRLMDLHCAAIGRMKPDKFPRLLMNRPAALVAASECVRQMEWAWLTGKLQGCDESMSCGYSRERILRDYNEHLEYEHIWSKSGFAAQFDADIHLAPEDFQP